MDGASGEVVCLRFSVTSDFLNPVFLRPMQSSFCMMASVPVLYTVGPKAFYCWNADLKA